MVATFINNAALLITLAVLMGIMARYNYSRSVSLNVLNGIWFGVIAIAAMMTPFNYQPGIFYDGRSIIMTLAGFWGGSITMIISVLIAAVYRVALGGEGIWAGLMTIVLCAFTGLMFRIFTKKTDGKTKILLLSVLGILSHAVMLASQLLLPWPKGIEVINEIWFPVMIIFPLTFVLMVLLLQGIEHYIASQQKIQEAETLYRTTLQSIGDAVICTDIKGNINQMNPVAEDLTGWKFIDVKGKKLDEVFRIINEDSRKKVESPFTKVIREKTVVGLANHTLLLSKDGREIAIADSGAPIRDIHNEVKGVVLVFRDQTEERQHQRELTASETRYREREFWLRESQRVGKIGSYDFDIQNNYWTSSEVLDDIFGISPENLKTLESWNAIIHPEQQMEMLEYFQESVVKGRMPFEKEYKIIRQNDGTERWVLGHGELNYNESGEPIRMFGTIQDITERIIFEKELSESEERFRKAVLLAPIPIMVHDENGNVINLSDGWTHFSGYSIDEISTLKEWAQKAYGEKAEEVETYVSGLFNEEKTIFSGEFEIISKTGEKRIWNFYTTPLGKLSSGKKIMLSMAPDITQRKRVQGELEESERSYRKLFEEHKAVKLLIDPENGQIIRANQAAANFYGWSIEELENMNIGQINTLPPLELKRAMENALQKKQPYFEFEHRLADGAVRDVEVFASSTEYAGKELLHSIVHDITEKKRLFDELVIAKEKAEESERLKSAFLANMSHEIRTPLNGILGFTSLLTEDENLSKETKQEFATIINKNADGLLKIISDILDISRLEAGKTIMEKKPFDVIKMLQTIYPVFNKRLADSGKQKIELKLIVPENSVILITDESRLMQVVSNLLDNSLKFTTEGNITFGVSKVTKTQLELFVSDTGIGISKEKQHLVFDRFSQAEDSTSRHYGGSGLGLAIVKKLVEFMEGEILLESEPGQGSVFRIFLPGKLDSYIHDEAPQPKKFDFSKQTESVLVVEDDPASQLLLSHVLKNHFPDLTLATTGSEALLIIKNKMPDIILMDIRLPDSNGLDVVRQIRKFDTNVYIIAQTAYAMADDEQKALEAGCNDFITKPIKVDLLFQKMRQTKEI